MKSNQFCTLLLMTILLAGCSSSGRHAPVREPGEVAKKSTVTTTTNTPRKKAPHEKDWRPEVHIVQKGETLYSIAFNYGFDYHELAELNGIQNPGVISLGQQIRLPASGATPATRPAAEAPPSPGSGVPIAAPVASAVAETKPTEALIKEQPKVVKYPYSEAAMVQIEKVQEPNKPDATTVAKADTKPEAVTDDTAEDGEDDSLEWSMPTKGKLIGEFSESTNKGIDIAGSLGQPIFASAPGKVVYSGSGLRGYGKLIIIKHNKTYLSAYAHNDQILVKEGQTITRGQKIAEMGNTDADQVKLHFEVRRLGKPVDPAKYLPLGKS